MYRMGLGMRLDRELLIVSHIHKVEMLARRIIKTVPPNISYDDLIGYGMEGLIKAAARYDSSRGVKFSTYVEVIIRYAIKDGLREMSGISRGRGVYITMFSELSTEEEHDIRDIEDENSRFEDIDNEIEVDLKSLLDRERNVIENYYYKNKSMAEIGKIIDRSEATVSLVHKKAIGKLREGAWE
jgi:RNA polymerase sigma factor (sigma-70 family)